MSLIKKGSGSGVVGLTPQQEEFLAIWSVDQDSKTAESAYALITTLNSLAIGRNGHWLTSGGQNLFTKNALTGINFFPVWQGVRPLVNVGDNLGINPTTRQYGKTFTFEPNGDNHATGSVAYEQSVTLTNNESLVKVSAAAGENYVGDLTYTVSVGDQIRYAQTIGVDVISGDIITFSSEDRNDFSQPSESFAGETIEVNIVKEGGENFTVRVGNDESTPWLSLVISNFSDVEVSAGVDYCNTSKDVFHSTVLATDTSDGIVTYSVSRETGLNSFTVFDAIGTFSANNCVVDFGDLTYPDGFIKNNEDVGGQPVGTSILKTKNDSFLFYWDTVTGIWRTLDLNTKNGGIA